MAENTRNHNRGEPMNEPLQEPKTGEDYTCAMCQGTFTAARDSSEALTESEIRSGELAKEDLAIICDDCFRKMMEKKRA